MRVGTCGALEPGLRAGELVVASEALAADGASRALGAGERVAADAELTAALRAAAPDAAARAGGRRPTSSTTAPGYAAPSALAVEMEAAALFRIAERRGVAAACVLGVSDELAGGGRHRLDEEALERLGEAVGRAGAVSSARLRRRGAPARAARAPAVGQRLAQRGELAAQDGRRPPRSRQPAPRAR